MKTPKMNRSHYVFLADSLAIWASKEGLSQRTADSLFMFMADRLKITNPQFDSDKFISACCDTFAANL